MAHNVMGDLVRPVRQGNKSKCDSQTESRRLRLYTFSCCYYYISLDFSHEENHNDWNGDQIIIILQQDIQYKPEGYEIICPQGI